jgi:hypothetical protein
MTFLAGFFFFYVSVVTALINQILGDFLVAIFAQAGLGTLVKLFVTFGTLSVYLDVPLDQFSRRYDVSQRVGLNHKAGGKKQECTGDQYSKQPEHSIKFSRGYCSGAAENRNEVICRS